MELPADKTLILGLGNPVRSDDGVGIHVIQALRGMDLPEGVELEEAGTAGLGILDLIGGYRRLILIDAIDIGLEPGSILELTPDMLAASCPLHAASSHEPDLPTSLELARTLGLDVPSDVRFVAVQVADIITFSESCTSAVQAAIGEACKVVRNMVQP